MSILVVYLTVCIRFQDIRVANGLKFNPMIYDAYTLAELIHLTFFIDFIFAIAGFLDDWNIVDDVPTSKNENIFQFTFKEQKWH